MGYCYLLLPGATNSKGTLCCLDSNIDKKVKSFKFYQQICVCCLIQKDFHQPIFLKKKEKVGSIKNGYQLFL